MISTKEQLAKLLDTTQSDFDNIIARLDKFYRYKSVPKPSGGFRVFYIPQGKLRGIQDKIKNLILKDAQYSHYLHGGVKGKSIFTNAKCHRRKQSVLVLDVKGFYPSIRPQRVSLVFERLGFIDEALRILTRLTTYKFQLPQGPPTSPAIANLCIPRMDARLHGLAKQQNFDHTRYMDDVAISGAKRLAKFRRLSARIVEEEGFTVKQGIKGNFMMQSERQAITNVTLNFKLNVVRPKREEILKKSADQLKNNKELDVRANGQLAFVNYANPKAGVRLVKATNKKRSV